MAAFTATMSAVALPALRAPVRRSAGASRPLAAKRAAAFGGAVLRAETRGAVRGASRCAPRCAVARAALRRSHNAAGPKHTVSALPPCRRRAAAPRGPRAHGYAGVARRVALRAPQPRRAAR
jgi:hypothetical protein